VQLELRAIDGRERRALATLPEGTRALAWTAAPPPANLAAWNPITSETAGFGDFGSSGGGGSSGGFDARRTANDAPFGGPERPGLVRLDIEAPGARIHAGLAADFAALRARVRTETGRDFLGTVSDMWRSLGFYSKGSAFFSWHKTGRAFDTTQELYGPGGRRDMVLVREDLNGRTYWRMFLRAGAQDGSVGRPLREPGWRFAVASDSELVRREGGERGPSVTGGWFIDFTAHAADYGWFRIPANRRAGFDWRENWAAIEFWHYERRDGLSWNEAARQVYDDETLATELDREQLRERGIATWRMGALGLPRAQP
jgi:TolB protein